jgi:hypothetical protein
MLLRVLRVLRGKSPRAGKYSIDIELNKYKRIKIFLPCARVHKPVTAVTGCL